jgi:hypothetical protein
MRAGLVPELTNFFRVARSSLVSLISGAVLMFSVYHIRHNFLSGVLNEVKNLLVGVRVRAMDSATPSQH